MTEWTETTALLRICRVLATDGARVYGWPSSGGSLASTKCRFSWRILAAASSYKNGRKTYLLPRVTGVASCKSEQEKATAPPDGGQYICRPNSGKRRFPPSNS